MSRNPIWRAHIQKNASSRVAWPCVWHAIKRTACCRTRAVTEARHFLAEPMESGRLSDTAQDSWRRLKTSEMLVPMVWDSLLVSRSDSSSKIQQRDPTTPLTLASLDSTSGSQLTTRYPMADPFHDRDNIETGERYCFFASSCVFRGKSVGKARV